MDWNKIKHILEKAELVRERESKFRIQDFPNLLDDFSFTSVDIEAQLEKYKLEFSEIRDRRVEWEICFPSFVGAFYNYMIRCGEVPSQRDYFQYYLESNKDFFERKKFDSEIVMALEARVFRTYPSLVRDIHFALKCREQFLDATVIYNIRLDTEKGIDVLIEKDGKFFGINLYVGTTRAIGVREKKKNRHMEFENVENIEFPLTNDLTNNVGDLFLYGGDAFTKLMAEME